ncbi:hypothetical protein [Dolichospermum sp. UHCC 0259]|uniref:hypothetical protein n=1 Tax=Dolichospermum sp. UHCC 0259 TaxID=2590010 RepID=UPI00144525DA|nr:hypothetical protein [Dolichospermum sp. UHCC 0259]MTJ46979.1 hypothetical protein [Dolichospermum sp. UHCC 0259]
MKLPFLILTFLLCEFLAHKSVNAKPQTVSNVGVEHNQSADLITQPITIDSYWNGIPQVNPEAYFSISNRECKKVNPLDYIKNPESFLKLCPNANNPNRKPYDPVEYLKVPPLDSGIKIKLGDF